MTPHFYSSLAADGVNLAGDYPQFLQIMHPTTFHIKNPSDAKLVSLSILRKLPVSMANIVKIEKYKKYNISIIYSSYFHNINFSIWTCVLQQYRSNGVMTLRFQSQLIAKIKIQHVCNSTQNIRINSESSTERLTLNEPRD